MLNFDLVSPRQGRVLSRRDLLDLLKVIPGVYAASCFARDQRYFTRRDPPKFFAGVPAERGVHSIQGIPGDQGSGPSLILSPDSMNYLTDKADQDGNWWTPPVKELSDFTKLLGAFVALNDRYNVIPGLTSLSVRSFRCCLELIQKSAGKAAGKVIAEEIIATEILGPLVAAALIADLVLLTREIYVLARDYSHGVLAAKNIVGRITQDSSAYIARCFRLDGEPGHQTITETAFFQNSWATHGDRIWECTYQEAV